MVADKNRADRANREDDRLLRLLNEKPEKGLEILMDAYLGLVYTIVYSKLSGVCANEDIEECASDIFYEIYKHRASVDLEKGSVKTYLSVLAKRRAIDVFRRVAKEAGRSVSIEAKEEGEKIKIPAAENVETEVENSETKEILINQIKALGEPDSEIFIRKYYYGQNTRLIAEELNLKENTVDKKVSRGLEKLKRAIGGAW